MGVVDLPRKALIHRQGQGQGRGPRRAPASTVTARPASRVAVPGQRTGQSQPGGGIYTAPMDHSYRAAQNNNSNGNQQRPGRGRGGPGFGKQFLPADPEPLPVTADAGPARIYAFVDDLFFLTKIQETGRKLNVKVEFVKTDKDLYERMGQNGDDKPSLIIFDLNNLGAKPLTTHSQAEIEAEEGHQHHRLRLARAGRAEDEGAGSGMRHGAAALGLLPELAATAPPPRRAGRSAGARVDAQLTISVTIRSGATI